MHTIIPLLVLAWHKWKPLMSKLALPNNIYRLWLFWLRIGNYLLKVLFLEEIFFSGFSHSTLSRKRFPNRRTFVISVSYAIVNQSSNFRILVMNDLFPSKFLLIWVVVYTSISPSYPLEVERSFLNALVILLASVWLEHIPPKALLLLGQSILRPIYVSLRRYGICSVQVGFVMLYRAKKSSLHY